MIQIIVLPQTSKVLKGPLPTPFDLPSAGSDNRKSGGIYSGQNLTPSKMAAHVSYLSTLRGKSELSSEVYIVLVLLQVLSATRLPPFRRLQLRTKQLQQEFTLDLRRQLR